MTRPEIDRAIQEKLPHVKRLLEEVHRVVVGQENMINRLLIGLFTNGHVLLEGVPGLAKTLTISSLAKALHLDFRRVQFTPDLLPADLIGTLIYNQREARFEVKQGPIFANLILADEINRSPAKVQSALLEAMQEKQVTIGDHTYPLPKPFLVLATQNPIDQEGTYPLPEAQVDRFMVKVHVSYPTRDQELLIMQRMAQTEGMPEIRPCLDAEQIMQIRKVINYITVEDRLGRYIVDLVMATREPKTYKLDKLAPYIEFGASPRATIALNLAARAHAFLQGRSAATPDDLKAIASDVLNHRILLSYEAEADGLTSRDLLQELLKAVPF
jgi:MoxR-like ATPase